MSDRFVKSVIGYININDEIEGYETEKKAPVLCDDGTYISSFLTRIIVKDKYDNTEKVYSPRVRQSCMNPEKKTILPVVIRFIFNEKHNNTEKIEIVSTNSVLLIDLADTRYEIHTEEYIPHIPTKDCSDCTNCGRC